MNQNWPWIKVHFQKFIWTLNTREPCIHQVSTSGGQILVPFAGRQPFSIYNVDENRNYRKCTKSEWTQTDLEYLTVKSTTHQAHTPEGQIFDPFSSTTSRFWDTRTLKIGKNRKCTEWPQTVLVHLTVKSTPYTLNKWSEWFISAHLWRNWIGGLAPKHCRA